MKILTDNEAPLHVKSASVEPGEQLPLDEMFQLMKASGGCGLAANQVGITKQFFIMSYGGRDYVCINPEILESLGQDKQTEGCLSFPGMKRDIVRAESIRVSYTNREGQRKTHRMNGFLARIFQHEFDHLQGVTFETR